MPVLILLAGLGLKCAINLFMAGYSACVGQPALAMMYIGLVVADLGMMMVTWRLVQ